MVASSFSTAGVAATAARRTRDVAHARHKPLTTKNATTRLTKRTYRKVCPLTP
jgi:hypothetical protein